MPFLIAIETLYLSVRAMFQNVAGLMTAVADPWFPYPLSLGLYAAKACCLAIRELDCIVARLAVRRAGGRF